MRMAAIPLVTIQMQPISLPNRVRKLMRLGRRRCYTVRATVIKRLLCKADLIEGTYGFMGLTPKEISGSGLKMLDEDLIDGKYWIQ